MSPQERIIEHRETIRRIREDMEWVRSIEWSDSIHPGETTDAIISRGEDAIQMYESFIRHLEAQKDA